MKKMTAFIGAFFLLAFINGQADQNSDAERQQNRNVPPQKNYRFWQKQNRYQKPPPNAEEEANEYAEEEHGGAGGGGR